MIQAIRGTKDLLPAESGNWQFIEKVFREVSSRYNYSELRTPVFEATEVFSRSIGDSTDIVNKEMYTFTDKGDRSITLRPEQTAALVRAVLQNNLLQASPNLRLWYFGPFFRYERPTQGRLRQFHQYGAECIGSPWPESDAEVIMLAVAIAKGCGINNFNLLINTLGNPESRKKYRDIVKDYFSAYREFLSEDSKLRLDKNPLRILDSKDRQDQEYIEKAPLITDHLDEQSREHFESVLTILRSMNIDYTLQPRLVRGLDYYSHTVFEFQSPDLGTYDSFGGGGRYDGLFEQLEGKPTPAVGFAMGVERMLLILENTKSLPPEANAPDIFMVSTNRDYLPLVFTLAEKLREKGLSVQSDLLRRSLKSQFRESNRLKAAYTIIIGEEEYTNNFIKIKKMATGEEFNCPIDEAGKFEF